MVGPSVGGVTEIETRPTPEQLGAVFGTRGVAARCWCQWFRVTSREWDALGPEELRRRTAADLASDEPGPGVVAVRDGEPVGWCAVAPRPQYRLARRPTMRSGVPGDDLDDPSVWALTCFVVRVGHRRQGVAGELLEGAVALARSGGARVLEAYPIDGSGSASELYHGTASMFAAAGFEEVARTSRTRTVVRLTL